MTKGQPVERRRFWSGGASPGYVVTLLAAVGGGGYVSHHQDALTMDQARALGEARTRYESLLERCMQGQSDRLQQDIRELRNQLQGSKP